MSGWGPHYATGTTAGSTVPGAGRDSEGVEMKAMASDQVERANEQERARPLTLAADVARSAVLLGLFVLATVIVALPSTVVVGIVS